MVGQGVLRECLRDAAVSTVLSVGRSPLGQTHEKLREVIHPDFNDFSTIENQLQGYDACFFSVGVSSLGLAEADYQHVIYDLTMAAAQPLARFNPSMTFIFVSGTGTDSTEHGPIMWARVKGKTENALLRLPFKAAYMFRPGIIQPLHGIKSKTGWYRVFYALTAPFISLLMRILPMYVTTTERLGRAVINVAKNGAPHKILENRDINELARLS